MASELPSITLKAIGIVRNEIRQGSMQDAKDIISDIIINDSLTETLDNLDGFSHIIVLYWMHQVTKDGPLVTRIHPKGRQERPLVGLFATRSPKRPNPMGMTLVRLLQRRGNILRVEGLDAIDGSPVIDIKPYIPENDLVANAKVPPWITNQ